MTIDIEAFLDMSKEEHDEQNVDAERENYLIRFFSRPQAAHASSAADYCYSNSKCIEILTYAKKLALAASAESRCN